MKISLAAGTGGLTAAGLPWRAWTSDLSAGIGQTRVATLDDGSLLTLTGSAADVRFSDALRLIVLRQGELHIATYRDAMTPARPLAVDTPMGRVLALGTRYLVRLHDDRVRVVVNDGAVRIEPAAAGAAGACRLEAGEGAWFDARRGRPDPRCTKTPGFKGRYMPTTCVWTRSSRNWALPARPAGLRSGRGGSAHFGILPLADTDRALAAVERALPVQVLRYTRYWVVLRGRA